MLLERDGDRLHMNERKRGNIATVIFDLFVLVMLERDSCRL